MEDLGGVSSSLRGSPIITGERGEGRGAHCAAPPPPVLHPSHPAAPLTPGAAGLPGAVRMGSCAGQGVSGVSR